MIACLISLPATWLIACLRVVSVLQSNGTPSSLNRLSSRSRLWATRLTSFSAASSSLAALGRLVASPPAPLSIERARCSQRSTRLSKPLCVDTASRSASTLLSGHSGHCLRMEASSSRGLSPSSNQLASTKASLMSCNRARDTHLAMYSTLLRNWTACSATRRAWCDLLASSPTSRSKCALACAPNRFLGLVGFPFPGPHLSTKLLYNADTAPLRTSRCSCPPGRGGAPFLGRGGGGGGGGDPTGPLELDAACEAAAQGAGGLLAHGGVNGSAPPSMSSEGSAGGPISW
mmetsp:Transcript_50391/g.96251  ORF Transcript_50391/g.96251 Transcript_50391/m.96251 type:complete len:289 (-) Transcript_50391:264-1130(-)